MWNWSARRDRREAELEAEIRTHLDLEAAEHRERGLVETDARAAARRAFGNVAVVQEEVRDVWGWTMIEQLVQDLRYALVTMRRAPGFALAAVLSLALGIGMNTSIFSLADAAVFRPLAIADPDSLLAIRSTSPERPFSGMSYPDFKDLRDRNRSFKGLIAHQLAMLPFARRADAVPHMRMGMRVSQDFFQTLGVEPALGRAFLPEETDVPGRDAVVVLSHGFWQGEFGADPDVIGQVVQISQTPVTVVGVAPADFMGMNPFIQPYLYVPVTLGQRRGEATAAGTAPSLLERRDERGFIVRGRLRDEVTRAQAQAEVTSLARTLAEEHPGTHRRHGAALRTEAELRREEAPGTLPLTLLLLTLSALVLVIVCTNVANLFLARARARSREMALRLAIGAGRFRLVRQLLTESALVACLGGAAGLGLAFGAVRYFQSIRIPTDTPIAIAAQMDPRVVAFSVVATILSVLAFGLVPAWQTSRADLVTGLKRSDVAPPRRRRMWGRQTLVVAQIAISLVLLVAAALMVDAFRRMLALDPGFRTDRILTMELDPSTIGYSDEDTRELYRRLVERTRTLPEVQAATLSRALPFRPSFSEEVVVPEGFELPPEQEGVRVTTNTVDDAYVDTLDIAIVGGRGFTGEDTADSRPTAVVNETFAATYWPGQDPMGKRVRLGSRGPWMEVVGVARTAKYLTITEAPQPYLYLPLEQHRTSRLMLLAHTVGDPSAAAGPIREIVRSLDDRLPTANTRALQTVYEEGALGVQRVILHLVSSMGLLGLCLALAGLYAVVTYSVRRRMRELAVRMSIGATPADILCLVMREGLGLTAGGVLLGLALSVPVVRALSASLAGLGPLSPWALALVPVGLILVTMAACLGPAWRASRVDPTMVLRLE